ncbi:MAG: M20/M25/M40 family metallo-hydrolase, partial [Anaerolinea sp.]|nr:M20/M25/M40 family metallo-hydrolase [Anaerolinea sp.]
ETTERLRALTAIPGISGHEDEVARAVADHLRPVADAVWIDSLANVIARIGTGDGLRIAFCAHLDTVGFLVKRIVGGLGDAALRVVSVGGVNLKAVAGALVDVHTPGDKVPGMIGVRSQHQSTLVGDGTPAMEDLFIHVPGQAHIPLGSMVTYTPQFRIIGQTVVAPYLDDRAGVALLIALAERLHGRERPFTVYLIATAQEETTAQGARVALRAVAPDAAFFIDGTVSYDTPETNRFGEVYLGSGPVLTRFLYIRGLAAWHVHPRLWQHAHDLAAQHRIKRQVDVVHGLMSDALAAADLGIPSAVIGLPMRSKHAPLEMIDLRDFDAASELLMLLATTPLPDLARG